MSEQSNVRLMVREEITALSQPLRNLVEGLDRDIIEARAKLDDLVTARHDAAKMLRLADPEFEPPKKYVTKNNGGNGGGRLRMVARPRKDEFVAWLRARPEITSFSMPELIKRDDFMDISSPHASAMCREMHASGELLLDRKSGPGGTKYYRLA